METLILVDEENRQIGIADKNSVHTKSTPLHRGFSLFLFNSRNELLLTRRALTKKTFPGVWTNTVCGHPGPGESNIQAAKRRLNSELGIVNIEKIEEIASYRYKFADQNGIVENEICPVLVAHSDEKPKPNPDEVKNYKWINWKNFLDEVRKNPSSYSPWSVEEAEILSERL